MTSHKDRFRLELVGKKIGGEFQLFMGSREVDSGLIEIQNRWIGRPLERPPAVEVQRVRFDGVDPEYEGQIDAILRRQGQVVSSREAA